MDCSSRFPSIGCSSRDALSTEFPSTGFSGYETQPLGAFHAPAGVGRLPGESEEGEPLIRRGTAGRQTLRSAMAASAKAATIASAAATTTVEAASAM